MIKNLLITYLFLITNVFAGLPPTTVKGQAEAVKTTTFNVEVPYSQATTTAAGTRLLEVGNNNILANGSFEHSIYDTGWTCSLGTKTKETTTVFKGKNSMKIVSAGAGTRCYIYSTTDAARLKGQQGHATVRVNSTDSVLQVCALAGGTTSAFDTNCVTVPVTTTDSPWKTVVIPTIMNGTGNGVVIKSAETLTKSVFVDEVEYEHGLPVQGVSGAKLVGKLSFTGNIWSVTSTSFSNFSAQTGITYTASGSVSSPSTNIPAVKFSGQSGKYVFIYSGALVGGSSSNVPCVFRFSDGANASETSQLNNTQATFSSTSTSLIGSIEYLTAPTDVTVQIQAKSSSSFCGVNYMSGEQGTISVFYYPPESKIYSQASKDYAYTNAGTITIGATTTAPTKGTIVTDRIMASRKGQNLIAEYQYEQSSAGSVGSGSYLFTLPSGLSFDTNIVKFNTGSDAATTNATVGYGVVKDGTSNTYICTLQAYNSTQFRVHCATNPSVNWLGSSGGFGLGVVTLSYNFRLNAPIQGWQDYGVIVGSFQGYNETPGTSRPVVSSVQVAAGTKSTVCTTGSCTLYANRGGFVSAASWSSTGVYNITLNPSVSSVTETNCVVSPINTSGGIRTCKFDSPIDSTSEIVKCTENTNNPENNLFTIMCHGSL